MDAFLTSQDSEIYLNGYETYLKEIFLALGANESIAAVYAMDIVNLEVDIAKVRRPLSLLCRYFNRMKNNDKNCFQNFYTVNKY
jgi:hypothetical protein